MIIAAIDPGRNGGAAAASLEEGALRSLGCWELFGEKPHQYMTKVNGLVYGLEELGFTHEKQSECAVLIEQPPGKVRRASTGTRHSDMWGLGRYSGLVESAIFNWLVLNCQYVPQSDWSGQLHPLIRPKKDGKGFHRLDEADLFFSDIKYPPASSNKGRGRRVAIAEAHLMIAAFAVPRGLKMRRQR